MSWDWLDVRYVFIAVELLETMSSEGARAKRMEWMEWNNGTMGASEFFFAVRKSNIFERENGLKGNGWMF